MHRGRSLRRRFGRHTVAPRYRIVHVIREGNDPSPVVKHVFYGKTKKEAEGIYAAHRSSDRFIRECDSKSCFAGKVPCHSEIRMEEG